jgi:hypothetical protein
MVVRLKNSIREARQAENEDKSKRENEIDREVGGFGHLILVK